MNLEVGRKYRCTKSWFEETNNFEVLIKGKLYELKEISGNGIWFYGEDNYKIFFPNCVPDLEEHFNLKRILSVKEWLLVNQITALDVAFKSL